MIFLRKRAQIDGGQDSRRDRGSQEEEDTNCKQAKRERVKWRKSKEGYLIQSNILTYSFEHTLYYWLNLLEIGNFCKSHLLFYDSFC